MGRGLTGSPLHGCLERGELGGHSGRGQKDVILRTVVEASELPAQGLADGQIIGRRRLPGQAGIRLPRGNDEPRMLPERAQGGRASVTGHDAMHAAKSQDFGPLAAGALNELRAYPSGTERWKGQARLPISDLPRQFSHLGADSRW